MICGTEDRWSYAGICVTCTHDDNDYTGYTDISQINISAKRAGAPVVNIDSFISFVTGSIIDDMTKCSQTPVFYVNFDIVVVVRAFGGTMVQWWG